MQAQYYLPTSTAVVPIVGWTDPHTFQSQALTDFGLRNDDQRKASMSRMLHKQAHRATVGCARWEKLTLSDEPWPGQSGAKHVNPSLASNRIRFR
jgi:hypothetical protein